MRPISRRPGAVSRIRDARFSRTRPLRIARNVNFIQNYLPRLKHGPALLVVYLRSRTFEGVTRTYRFRADGEPEGTTINIYQVRGGRIAWLGTTDELVR